MQRALESVFEQTARLAGAEDPEARGAGETIEAAAREMAARLSRFEEPALGILVTELGGPEAEAPPPVPEEVQEELELSSPPSRLTRVLAGELSQIARQADAPLDPTRADVLRPRIRRAARLANLWLTKSVHVSSPESPAAAPGRTSTYGPRRPETHTRTHEPAALPDLAPGVAEDTRTTALLALTDRVGGLQQAYGELQERAAARERYWREAIHELRNAAHAFMSWGFVLRRSELKDTPWFAPLVRSADAVLRRAEEALDPARVEKASFGIRPVRVNLVVAAREALQAIRPAADARNIALATATPAGGEAVQALADPDRLQQILHNLLRNAVEATPPGGSICITVGHDDHSTIMEVEDTGPGVPADIFESLPPEGRTGAGSGFGVGLRLSRDLTERMGGSLAPAPSELGGGARFVLRLPPAEP